jgi:hypothetical protein
MDLLEEKGWIVEARSKSKSVVFTQEGEALARTVSSEAFWPPLNLVSPQMWQILHSQSPNS